MAWPTIGLAYSPFSEPNMSTELRPALQIAGVGLHSGAETQVVIYPAPIGSGRVFVRVDLADRPEIPATVESVHSTTLSTELRVGEASIRTVEHLLAALTASGIADVRIEIDGPEVPLLDGSAELWMQAIEVSSLHPGAIEVGEALAEAIWIYRGDQFVAAIPAPELRFTYGIDFDLKPIGNQWFSWQPNLVDFREAVAPARTFGMAHQIEQLRQAGLIKGGSLENALVCDGDRWLNPPLRFENEPVRHKMLDLIGDLSLLGRFPRAHFIAYKASHDLHTQLAQKLRDAGF
jgi:UDP-3-O-[3-hydroxymyristoyl] N-acetylglucosamine deacetylase